MPLPRQRESLEKTTLTFPRDKVAQELWLTHKNEHSKWAAEYALDRMSELK